MMGVATRKLLVCLGRGASPMGEGVEPREGGREPSGAAYPESREISRCTRRSRGTPYTYEIASRMRTTVVTRCSIGIASATASPERRSSARGSATASTKRPASMAMGTTDRCTADLGRDQSPYVGRNDGQFPRRPCEFRRFGQQLDESHLVGRRDLEQVREQIAPVDDLTGEGLFDLPHGRDLTLDNEGAQGHWAS